MSSGLRRFVDAPTRPQAVDIRARPGPPEPEGEPCELCGTPAGPGHGHVVDTEDRSLMCACRACYLLFTRPNAGGGRFRAVPERYLHDPSRPLTAVEWETLGIPVGSVFFLRGADGVAAFYPSPAGATECLLDLDAWAELAGEHPLLAEPEPDVEAVLIYKDGDAVEYLLVPIDACYQLVGIVRMYWQGFDGGTEAREHIESYLAELRAAAREYS